MVRLSRTAARLSTAVAIAIVMPASALAVGERVAASKSQRAATSAASASAALDSGVLDRLNGIRADHGLALLTLDRRLSAAALQHTDDMLARGYFAHESSDGTPFWKRIRTYYPPPRYGYWSVGENLLWAPGAENAAAALKAWMASPEHRANILNPGWRQVGIAAEAVSDAPGTFHGQKVTVITTDFGVRR